MTTTLQFQILTIFSGALIFAFAGPAQAQIMIDSEPISLETGLRTWLEGVDREEKNARKALSRATFEGEAPSNTAAEVGASPKEIGQLSGLSFAKCTTE